MERQEWAVRAAGVFVCALAALPACTLSAGGDGGDVDPVDARAPGDELGEDSALPGDTDAAPRADASGGGDGLIAGVGLTSGAQQPGGTSAETASVSPAAQALVLLWVASTTGVETPSVPTATGAGMGWELVATRVRNGGGPRRISVLRSLSSAPQPGPVVIDFGAQPQSRILWGITQHSGVDASGQSGAGAVVQVASAEAAGFESGAVVNLQPGEGPRSATVGGVFSGAPSAMVPGPGLEEMTQDNIGTSTSGSFYLLSEYKPSFDGIVDATWEGTAHWIAIGMELRPAP